MRLSIIAVLVCITNLVYAHSNYTGRSGAPGRQTCASSCHGGPVVNTVQISGFPAEYVPGQAYLLTIRKISGGTIVNFNGSCRIGMAGTANAGVISAGLSTTTYNVTGETNGVRFATPPTMTPVNSHGRLPRPERDSCVFMQALCRPTSTAITAQLFLPRMKRRRCRAESLCRFRHT